MKIKKQKLFDILSLMQAGARIYFKDDKIFQIENDIIIYNKFFKSSFLKEFNLPFTELLLILSKLQDKDIDFREYENNIIIEAEKTKIELLKQEHNLKYNFIEINNWVNLPDNFISGIQYTSLLLSDKNVFCNFLFVDNDKIVSSDGKCLLIYNLSIDFNKFFLTSKQAKLLVNFRVTQYCIKDNLIYFSAEDGTIIAFNFLTDLKFPDYKTIQLINEKEVQFLDKINLSDLEVNSSILDEENKILKIKISKDNISIKSDNNFIKIKTVLNRKNKINFQFGISIIYLMLFLRSDYCNKFKTFLDSSKILFKNDNITFISSLLVEENNE